MKIDYVELGSCEAGHTLTYFVVPWEEDGTECPLCAALDKVANLEFEVEALREKVQLLEERP